MRKRKTNRKPIPSRTMIISTEQAESFNIRFDIECLNTNHDPLLKNIQTMNLKLKWTFMKNIFYIL